MLLWLVSPVFANIVNGNLELDFPATVALGAQFGDMAYSACTGTLITPRIILTAAHCGSDLPPELIVQAGKAFFGNDVYTPDAVLGFSSFVLHPNYVPLESSIGGTLGEYDFSLLVLIEDAPVEPILFWRDTIDSTWIGKEIWSIGFGITGPNANDAGTKRSASLRISNVNDMFVLVDNNDNPTDSNICSGDSGGTQMFFHEDWGQWIQIAVHSWGDQYCASSSGSTRTDIVADWIFTTIESVHGSTDICAINGYYDDDTCTTLPMCEDVDPACIVEEEKRMACQSSGAPEMGLFALVSALLSVFGGRKRQT